MNKCILIVDDESRMRKLIKDFLTAKGYQTIEAEDGEKAIEVYEKLSKSFMCTYDDTASIGKRYRREDVIGTPYCITIDDNTINNNTVTVRDRDTMKQEVINLDDLVSYIEDKVRF